jgi:hypothetical protein
MDFLKLRDFQKIITADGDLDFSARVERMQNPPLHRATNPVSVKNLTAIGT